MLGRQFWVAAAERENAGRFIVRTDEKLTAFLELESAIRPASGWRQRLVRGRPHSSYKVAGRVFLTG